MSENVVRSSMCILLAGTFALFGGCSRVKKAQENLAEPDPLVRAAAVDSLHAWKTVEAAPLLRQAIGDSMPGIRERIVDALGSFAEPADIALLISMATNDPDDGVRAHSARALMRIAPDSALGLMVPLLQGPTATRSLRTANALTRMILAAQKPLAPQTRERLGASLGGVVMSMQAHRGETPGNWRAWESYLDGHITPEDTADVAADQAAVALAWLGGAESGGGLMSALRGTISPLLRDSLLSVIASRDDQIVARGLIDGMHTNVVAARKRTIRLLGRFPHSLCVEELLALTSDRDASIRREAWQSLLHLHGYTLADDEDSPRLPRATPSPRVREGALRAMTSADLNVAMSAAMLRAQSGDVEGVRALVRIGRSGGSRVLATTCRALSQISPDEATAPDVAPVIARALRSAQVDVRVAGYRALGTWGMPDPESHVRAGLNDGDGRIVRAALDAAADLRLDGLMADVLSAMAADSLTRPHVAHALSAMVGPATTQYVVLALSNRETNRRRTAVEAVRLLASRVWKTDVASEYEPALARAAPFLARIAYQERNPVDRKRALEALGYISAPETDEALGVGLDDPEESVRLTAVIGLARQRPRVSAFTLGKLARTGSEAFRLGVVKALGEIGSEQALEAVRNVSVLDMSPKVRQAAYALLGR